MEEQNELAGPIGDAVAALGQASHPEIMECLNEAMRLSTDQTVGISERRVWARMAALLNGIVVARPVRVIWDDEVRNAHGRVIED